MKKLILSLVFVFFLVCIALVFYFHPAKESKSNLAQQLTPSPVEIKTVKNTLIPNKVTATGNLVANQSTNISPKVNGYVTHIFYHEGESVKTGDILIQLDNRTEKDALNSAKAALLLSQLQYSRNQKLLKQGLITQDVYYNSKVINQQNLALVTADETNLANKTIAAPFSGILGSRNISMGDFVTAGSKLTTLMDIDRLRVEYSLPTETLSLLKLNQPVSITSANLPGKKYLAKVSYISAAIDPDTQTIGVHATLKNDNELKPGQFVTITQELGAAKSAILIPTQSVFASLKGYYVYSVKNGKAIKIPISIGNKFENTIEATQGLNVGDKIIVAGQQYLSEGKPVSIVNPSENSE